MQALENLQPACDLTGRVASPAPCRACKLSYPERFQVYARVCERERQCVCVCVEEEEEEEAGVKCVSSTMS